MRRPHDADFAALSLFNMSQGHNLFVDVGANRGQSIESILLFRPDAEIIAFEPNPILHEYLVETYRTYLNVHLYNLALGDQKSIAELFIPSYRGYPFDALASLKYQHTYDWLGERTLFFFSEKHLSISKHEVPCVTLDSYDLKPSFIKIDVEGFEYQVVLGAINTIARWKPVLLIESLSRESPIIPLLERQGYRIYAFKDGLLIEDEVGQINSFLINESSRTHLLDHIKKTGLTKK